MKGFRRCSIQQYFLVATLLVLVVVTSCDVRTSYSQGQAAPIPSSPSASPGFGYARQWGSLGGLSSPNGVAIDASGNLYLADAQNYAVGKMAKDGTFVAAWGGYGNGPGQFSNPLGVAVDSSGNVFATDSVNNNVQEFSSAGVFVRSWNSNGTSNGVLVQPQGIAVNATGFVYIVDGGNQRVGIFRNDGSFVKYFFLSRKGQPEPGNFTQAMGLAVDSQGSVYVDDSNFNPSRDRFAGNITKFTKNGGFVMSWGGANFGGTLFSPQGLAVDGSFNVYVADSYARVQKFNAATTNPSLVWSTGSYGTTPGHFSQPMGVALDGLGNLFVSDPLNLNVQEFSTSTGTYIASLSYQRLGFLSTPSGVALDRAGGNVYVADYDNDRIQKFNATSGAFLLSWGTPGNLTGQFNGPSWVAVDHIGNVYVTDYRNNRVQKFSSAGTFIIAWSNGVNNMPFCGLSGIAVDVANNVYVTDYDNSVVVGCNRVQKFDSNGNFLASWGTNGSGNGQFYNPQGIAIDQSSNMIYVSDSGNNRIEKFTGSGIFVAVWGSRGSQNGQFSLPQGLGLDSGGDVYVADTLNNRVQEFQGNGSFVTSFGSTGPGNGQFAGPTGIVVDSSDSVYVTDNNQFNPSLSNNRVEVFMPFHDTGIPRFIMSRNTAYQNIVPHYPIILNVTVANYGLSSETFWLRIFANSTLIGNQNFTLATGQSKINIVPWVPPVSSRAVFNITGQAELVLSDPNPSNNLVKAGLFYVRLAGDDTGDCRVDVSDLAVIGAAFGKTLGQPGYSSASDLNNDYVIEVSDLAILGANFGRSC